MALLVQPATDGENWVIMGRLYWPDGALLDQSTSGTDGIVDVTLTVYDESTNGDPSTAIYAPSNLTVASVLFASLQTDGFWTLDATGYNFRKAIPFNAFEAHGGHTYRIEFRFNPHADNVYGPKLEVCRIQPGVAISV